MNDDAVRIGVSLSTFAADPATADVVDRAVELAAEAAGEGLHTVWFGQMGGPQADLSPGRCPGPRRPVGA